MEGGKKSTRPCAKCGKQFIPTTERKLTCEACYRLNSQIPPMAEEPDSVKRKKHQCKTILFLKEFTFPRQKYQGKSILLN